MESHRYLSFVFVMLVSLLGSSQAYNFYVGGKNGWELQPSESYDDWAGRNRFQINDSLIFKYNKSSDSVLVVAKEDYQNCYKSNPIQTLDGGDSVFKFDRSGPFYFISGYGDHCEKGQKLVVVVLAVRNATHKSPTPSPLSPPSPAADTPKAEAPMSTDAPKGSHVGSAPAPAPSDAVAVGGSGGFVVVLSVVLGLFFWV
ncbi:Early nodulin-like protein [Actinidia chinensis var. chinensis]|uniref:Early nodulin-like protein n=1 Tax=Actinidia chinensis var. chinensis TaxID=1590841 RepID=A0A2R6QC40_ACTCC|nr:Early nodulin-like protein [Actinidia chinensis var. chinensis]